MSLSLSGVYLELVWAGTDPTDWEFYISRDNRAPFIDTGNSDDGSNRTFYADDIQSPPNGWWFWVQGRDGDGNPVTEFTNPVFFPW